MEVTRLSYIYVSLKMMINWKRKNCALSERWLREILVAVWLFCPLPLTFGLSCVCGVYGVAWRAHVAAFRSANRMFLVFFSFGCGIVWMLRVRYMWVVDGVEMRADSPYYQKYRVIVAGGGSDLVRSGPKVQERILCTSI